MSAITVTTQAELDAALREHGDDASTTIIIDSPRGVWVTISDTGKATVEATLLSHRPTLNEYGRELFVKEGL